MRASWSALGAALWAALCGSPPALAQEELPPPPPPAANPPAAEGPVPTPPPADDCVPRCRTGYACQQGQCVSACQPPCPAGQRCTDAGCQETASASQLRLFDDAEPPQAAGRQAAAPHGRSAGAREHDGFMLRLTAGLGGAAASEDTDVGKLSLAGGAGNFVLDIGASVTDNLIVHGRLGDFVVVEPTVSIDDEKLGAAENSSLSFFLLGAAISYYIMPINLYLTAALGPSWARVEVRDEELATDTGIGASFDIGKEWWVGASWGLGVAGRLWFSQVPDNVPGTDQALDLSFVGFALLFSATYQ